jgi:hypothetical protein
LPPNRRPTRAVRGYLLRAFFYRSGFNGILQNCAKSRASRVKTRAYSLVT